MKRMLDTKIALVTGGNSGIGRASAILFAQEGAKVAITGRNAADGEAVVAEIAAGGGEAIFIQSDLTVAGAASAAIAQVVSTWGRLDCAFNNAGVSGGGLLLDAVDEAAWDSGDRDQPEGFVLLPQGRGGPNEGTRKRRDLVQRLDPRGDRAAGNLGLQRQQGRRRIARARRGGGAWAIRHPGEYHQPIDHADTDGTGGHHERPGR